MLTYAFNPFCISPQEEKKKKKREGNKYVIDHTADHLHESNVRTCEIIKWYEVQAYPTI